MEEPCLMVSNGKENREFVLCSEIFSYFYTQK